MHQIELRGSYRQMGHQQGYSLREAGFNLPPPDPKMLRFARQCEELVGQFAPELLDELHGLAEASEVDYAALLTVTLTAPYDAGEVPVEDVRPPVAPSWRSCRSARRTAAPSSAATMTISTTCRKREPPPIAPTPGGATPASATATSGWGVRMG